MVVKIGAKITTFSLIINDFTMFFTFFRQKGACGAGKYRGEVRGER